MLSTTTILTHPGGAHKDEFLACSVLASLHRVKIIRRESTPEDLRDPSVCVVDVGHEHNPARNNFDHHQFPPDHPPTCALSLVLQHLGLYEDARRFCEWLQTAEWFDARGPFATAQWLGVDRDALNQLNSPIDVTLLRRFALSKQLEPGDPLWEIMRMIGEDLLDFIKSSRARLDFLSAQAAFWEFTFPSGPAKILFLPRIDPLPDEPSAGIDRFIESRGLTSTVVGVVSPDRRSGGYALTRFRDHPQLDFTRVAGQPGVHFTHSRGFVAKTSATDLAQLKHLINVAAGAATAD